MMKLGKRNSSVELATIVLAFVFLISGRVLADGYGIGWIVGKKFIINNITPFNGIPPCQPANPNTVAFYPAPYNGVVQNGTVKVVGQFDGAGFGVCAGTFYGVDPSVTITYEIWGDLVIYRVPGRVGTASKVVPIKNGLAFIDNGQDFPVSILTLTGNAKR